MNCSYTLWRRYIASLLCERADDRLNLAHDAAFNEGKCAVSRINRPSLERAVNDRRERAVEVTR